MSQKAVLRENLQDAGSVFKKAKRKTCRPRVRFSKKRREKHPGHGFGFQKNAEQSGISADASCAESRCESKKSVQIYKKVFQIRKNCDKIEKSDKRVYFHGMSRSRKRSIDGAKRSCYVAQTEFLRRAESVAHVVPKE